MIRSFDWRDFPSLHRNRHHGLYLDTSVALTRSLTRIPVGALLSYVAPATGIFTYVATNDGDSSGRIIGQFSHNPGSHYAHLVFLAPEKALASPDTPALLDYIAQQAGKRGAHNLLAEVNERSVAFDVLRKAGFAIYSRQRIWRIDREAGENGEQPPWKPVTEKDQHAIRHLYSSLVPALVQQAEPPPWENMNGLVCYHGEELLGYVRLIYGPHGILAQPFIHPNVEQASAHIAAITRAVPNRRSRPLYMVVRSHQAWLELYLTELNAEPGLYQAVMVKRLVIPQKIVNTLKLNHTGLENIQPETPSVLIPSGNEPVVTLYDTAKNYR